MSNRGQAHVSVSRVLRCPPWRSTAPQSVCYLTYRWGGRVLYGDTDSLFVLVERKSLEAAFEIGREIGYAVTQQNPFPIELQLEKVFFPCCLVSKKRYVGYAYTSPSAKPSFDAKGIETVRRDQCGCTSNVLESTLRTLFSTRDLSCVKRHLQRQWTKILRSDISLKHFIFFRKCRLGSYKAEKGVVASGSLPPQAKVAYERMCAVAEICSGSVLKASPAVNSTAHSLANLQHGAPTRGERVPFVYADASADNMHRVTPGQRFSVRVLDCAVAPDRVIGGGRGGAWMQLFCRGTPQLTLRNVFPRTVSSGRAHSWGVCHAGEARFCGEDSENGESVRRVGDVQQAFLLRGYVQAFSSETVSEENGVFADICGDTEQTPDSCLASAVWKARRGYHTGACRSEEQHHQTLAPLYARYYIVKQIIPALDRLLSLLPPSVIVDLTHWYMSMPDARRASPCPQRRLRRYDRIRRIQRVQRLPGPGAATVCDADQLGARDCPQGFDGDSRRQPQARSRCYRLHGAQVTRAHTGSIASSILPRSGRLCEPQGVGTQRRMRRRRGDRHMKCTEENETDEEGPSARRKALQLPGGRLFWRAVKRSCAHQEREDGCIDQVAAGLSSELREAEQKYLEMEALCEACAGSKICGAACSHAWHCDIYFLKLRNENRISELLSRMHGV